MKFFMPQMLRCLSCRHGSTGFDAVGNVDRYYMVCDVNAKLPNEKCKNYKPAEGARRVATQAASTNREARSDSMGRAEVFL
jgi:hypothetical protein